MRKSWMLAVMLVVAVNFGWLGMANAQEGHDHDEAAEKAEETMAKKYVCPMHADVQSNEPGECPKCGMTLKQAAHEETPGEDSHKGHHHKH